jgi:UDP-2-acetamido-2-deoxy-ribo-hexuluronate aminotransferase
MLASMIPFNDLATQQQRLRPQIDAAIARVLTHGQYIMGPEVGELEASLAARVGVKHCLTMASGTTALEIALRALGIGPGDEVITTPFTWIATANAISLVGAIPVFVDIRANASYLIDPELVAAAITPRTRAIMPVSLFGQMAELDRIAEAAPGIPIIEDAAQSFGATRRGRPSCGSSLVACTSFFPTKPLGCYGDGGALFTDDDRIADLARAIRTHGGKQRHHHTCIGTNGRMDTLQAAITLAKLESFDAELALRQTVAERYCHRLGGVVGVPIVLAGNTCAFAQFTIRPLVGQTWDRDAVAANLKRMGYPTSVYYPRGCHQQPSMNRLPVKRLPITEEACRQVLSLPFSPWLSAEDQDRIADAVSTTVQ